MREKPTKRRRAKFPYEAAMTEHPAIAHRVRSYTGASARRQITHRIDRVAILADLEFQLIA